MEPEELPYNSSYKKKNNKFINEAKHHSLIDNLREKDIVLGIKLDLGSEFLMEGSKEKYTLGLDDLAKRASHFYEKGARFAKWRCIL